MRKILIVSIDAKYIKRLPKFLVKNKNYIILREEIVKYVDQQTASYAKRSMGVNVRIHIIQYLLERFMEYFK